MSAAAAEGGPHGVEQPGEVRGTAAPDHVERMDVRLLRATTGGSYHRKRSSNQPFGCERTGEDPVPASKWISCHRRSDCGGCSREPSRLAGRVHCLGGSADTVQRNRGNAAECVRSGRHRHLLSDVFGRPTRWCPPRRRLTVWSPGTVNRLDGEYAQRPGVLAADTPERRTGSVLTHLRSHIATGRTSRVPSAAGPAAAFDVAIEASGRAVPHCGATVQIPPVAA